MRSVYTSVPTESVITKVSPYIKLYNCYFNRYLIFLISTEMGLTKKFLNLYSNFGSLSLKMATFKIDDSLKWKGKLVENFENILVWKPFLQSPMSHDDIFPVMVPKWMLV